MATACKYFNRIALLVSWSAILLFASCQGQKVEEQVDPQTVITQQSDTLVVINYEAGIKKYRFSTPLMEHYGMASEPFMEFRKGIYIEMYADSSENIASSLTADYAIYWENRKLWETKGNVVSINEKGERIETQQLFWDQRSRRIYSNVDTKVTTGDIESIGQGFESDESMTDYEFRRSRGKLFVDMDAEQDGAQPQADKPKPATAPRTPGAKPAGADRSETLRPAGTVSPALRPVGQPERIKPIPIGGPPVGQEKSKPKK